MLLPITFGLPPVSALIMLAGIYYGSQYGGSTTAILVNLPGEAASVVTALDGYQMARQGHAGKALATAAIGSFFAGTVATVLIALFAPPLAQVALEFGPPDYFSLMVLGLVAAVVLAHGSLLHAFGMVVLGLLLGLIGTDVNSGAARYTFDLPQLADGIGFVIVAMGMFGLGEIVRNLENESDALGDGEEDRGPDADQGGLQAHRGRRSCAAPRSARCSASCRAAARSWVRSPPIRSRRRSPRIRAVSARAPSKASPAPESANNAGAQTSFIPMLTLGIPSNPVMALMIGAMIIQGIQPGPSVITEQPALFWGIIVSMWIGNFFLIVLNLPLIGLWVRLIMVPYHYLFPLILVFCGIGVFSLNNSDFDIHLMALFGFLGYVFAKLDCEPAPMLLGFILGPLMEEYLRRALIIGRGDWTVFVTNPISATMLVLAVVAMVFVLMPAMRKKRDEAFVEES